MRPRAERWCDCTRHEGKVHGDRWASSAPSRVTNDQINCEKEYYRLSSTCGAPRNHTNFQPWTHTSDDSCIYQLSLVLATAIVSSRSYLDQQRRCSNRESDDITFQLFHSRMLELIVRSWTRVQQIGNEIDTTKKQILLYST